MTVRDRWLQAWARLVTARPWATIALFTLLSVGSIAYTLLGLEFRSDRSDLVDPSTPWQQRYAAFKRDFPRWDDAVVVIDLESAPDAARAEAFIAALEARLRADDAHFKGVTAGFEREQAPAGLIYLAPLAQVEAAVDGLKKAAPVLAQPSLPVLLSLSVLAGTALPPAQRHELTGLLGRIAACEPGDAATNDPLMPPPLPSVLGTDAMRGVQRLVSSTERLATVLVSLRTEDDRDVDGRGGSIAALRGHLQELRALPEFAGLRAGVTGVPVLESDETVQSTRDASLASAISLALIALLLIVVYRGFVVPILAVVALLCGMALSFAWATLAVGHLQLLSVTFASMLLGLGIDVAIHIIARLELVHPDHDHLATALADTFCGVGPGILTASITVAAAAGAMAFTSFSGVGEMGIIAAGGILLCTIVIMSVLPAMLMIMPRPEARLRAHDGGVARPFMGGLGVAFHRRPWLVVACAAMAFVVAGALAPRIRYDTDLQKLMPSGTESVVWQQALEFDDAKSVWHAVVMARNATEARELTARLRALPEVAEVGGAGILFGSEADARAKQDLLRELPTPAPEHWIAPEAFDPPDSMRADLRAVCTRLARLWREADPALASAAERVGQLSDDGATRAIRSYMNDRRLLHLAATDLRMARPPGVEDLPAALRETMAGANGGLLLRVYPAAGTGDFGSASPLAPERLGPFARAVLGAAPHATGPSIQIFESTRLITRAYAESGVYALLAIIALLLLDFGLTRAGILDTMCALVPVLGGGVLLLAWMVVAGIELNFANMIVMPLIVGIGVGCGVHCVRRWRLQPNDEPLGLAGGSGRGMTLTTLTTVIGFAAMMTAEHRGIRSLGFVMSIGLMMVWSVTVLLLPSILKLRGPHANTR